MKKILITGKNSYIGNAFAEYLSGEADGSWLTERISLRENAWQETSWKGYNVILHVAGVAHVDTRKATEEIRNKYYAVNRNLTLEVAQKAKQDGVPLFIYMSSMIVFGSCGRITKETQPSPLNFYGDSKFQAEEGLLQMAGQGFKVAIVRSPFVYGRDSKGNYPLLARFGKRIPIFPKLENRRSMIYIDNLCECLRLLAEREWEGIFHPQNKEVVSTARLVEEIARVAGHKLWLTSIFNPVLKRLTNSPGLVQKVFGTFYYDPDMSVYEGIEYQIYSLEDSIQETEGK